jgi:hypothetical protein
MTDKEKRDCLLELSRTMIAACVNKPEADPHAIIDRYLEGLAKIKLAWAAKEPA